MTDGCVNISGRGYQNYLSSKDEDWLNLIRELICPEKSLTKKNNCFELSIYSKELSQFLISKGCVPKKSLTLQFPTVPEKYLPDFIRGCMDGDGSINTYIAKKKYKNKTYEYEINRCYLCSASKDFIIKSHNIFMGNKLDHYFYEDKLSATEINGRQIKNRHPTYRVLFVDNDAKNFLKWAYYDQHPLSMPRKNKLAQMIINNSLNA
jgi:hypothetical protein